LSLINLLKCKKKLLHNINFFKVVSKLKIDFFDFSKNIKFKTKFYEIIKIFNMVYKEILFSDDTRLT